MLQVRPALPDDAVPIAAIFEQGVEDRVATFETAIPAIEEPRTYAKLDGESIVDHVQGVAAAGDPDDVTLEQIGRAHV